MAVILNIISSVIPNVLMTNYPFRIGWTAAYISSSPKKHLEEVL